ncbi:hypothetical protein SAMN04488054_12822 [Salibacterium qingdaonense]|uniref:Uncharacterized protein n=1 Tax=Salibacterium qingdaonense TaxID=266892 RepID=A0A1I4PLB7_9BACI|nr:hypothetical protein SAMN04488054_12822 [Salibacterium qingdaonense]
MTLYLNSEISYSKELPIPLITNKENLFMLIGGYDDDRSTRGVYVLEDSWYASASFMAYIQERGWHLIGGLKSNSVLLNGRILQLSLSSGTCWYFNPGSRLFNLLTFKKLSPGFFFRGQLFVYWLFGCFSARRKQVTAK